MSRPLASWLVLSALCSVPAAAQQGAVAGTVYDSLAGAPLAGARVSLTGTDRGATTDSAGVFRITDVPAGEHGITFDHPRLDQVGWLPDTLRARVEPRGDTRVDLAIPSLIRLGVLGCRGEAAPGTSVAVGHVADAATGRPIPGARVAISWAGAAEGLEAARVRTEAIADDEGHWYACELPQGAMIVARVDQPGYQRRDVSFYFDAPSAVHTEFMLAPGGRGETAFLTGRVLSQQNGAPLQGAVVAVEGTTISAMSNDLGFWELANVPPGHRTLRVRHAGAERALPVRVPEGGVVDVEVRVPPDAYTLAPITVTAARNLGILQGFYERRQSGYGQYLTRAEVQQRGAHRVTDLLGGMMRGRERCGPLLFLDGMYVASGLDFLNVADVEGVEYYQSGLTTPLEFLRGNGRCSVLAVWTRRGGALLDEET
ncbi:carboxypeptidase regulatory-like domain-containing protein [Longimicrobium sp.]|uniref:carboxypeptidase regulatory-like domain-containing protein n=1 Tax=Longimicrobium sp. TaxID=2029185 RepID=UPI002E344989|nr:carboxypeptidase regulatory-like domain-containing protein [Longimicrobium sp.]HEX6039659.1 carboxypeptidase regulatory-like domain-containing protein [Longimicrobium sp.]